MAIIVQKYGGTSVGSVERIQSVARRVAYTVAQGHQVVVVVSAMGIETDRLVDLANDLAPPTHPTHAHQRELDMLLSTGEQVSIALLAIALQQQGCAALSLTGSQASIRTTRDHTRARIVEIDTTRIRRHLDQGQVVVVAGFQGIAQSTDFEITTLGRGGSDTTAVALAAALQAAVCEIYTDVPGVLTTDPRLVPSARLLSEITSDEMLELASLGAQVLHPRAVEIARNFGLKLRVLSSQSEFQDPLGSGLGTVVLSASVSERPPQGIEVMQAVDDVVLDLDQVKIVMLRVPDHPGIAAQLFRAISAAGVNVDLILQSVDPSDQAETNDISFTVSRRSLQVIETITHKVAAELGCPQVLIDHQVAKVSIGGAGMIGRPGIAADMFQVIADAGINLQMISMSEIKVSCIVDSTRASEAALNLGWFFRVIPQTHQPTSSIPTQRPVRGIALDSKQSRLAILQVPDQPGSAALVFKKLAAAGVVVDTVMQSQRGTLNAQGIPTNDIAFTVPKDQAPTAEVVLQAVAKTLEASEIVIDHAIAKVSIVGAEMEAHPGIAAQMFQTLADAEINIEMIATSEIKVTCVVALADGVKALQAIHQAFALDQE